MTIRIKVKTEIELLERLRDLIQRHKKRYIKTRMKPKGSNCVHRVYDEARDEWRCAGCGSIDPDVCLNHDKFHPEHTVENLKVAFREDLCNTQRMLRDYRDIATLLWALGQFDDPEEFERTGKALFEERIVPDTLRSDT